ncbi:hypothetical protein [Winogradskyella sp. 3972H.M.0a.05]|uniref:hypothetical protein n=1 Tax=Winogradskyella sp. 3972H.M.0a.05 TaxID=2950277 RepID=UPI00339A0BBC
MQETLILKNRNAVDYFASNFEKYNITDEIAYAPFEEGIISTLNRKSWGFYDILTSKTVFKKDTVFKTALVGEKQNLINKNALFVTDYDKPLKLSGRVTINGNIKVPIGRVEEAYVNNQTENKILVTGTQLPSVDEIPRLNRDINIDFNKCVSYSYSDVIEDKELINSFKNETKLIEVTGSVMLNDITLKGNIIFKSNSEIIIGNNTIIEDILLIAPKVVISSGFLGNMQIIADKNVVIEEESVLKYPSSIYLKNDIDSVSVTMKKNSKLLGGIVINGNTYKGSLKRSLIIAEEAKVIGDIYCFGRVQLEGTVYGSVVTDRFFLSTKTAEYENILSNAEINLDSLPKNFIGLPLFISQPEDNNTYEIVKEF